MSIRNWNWRAFFRGFASGCSFDFYGSSDKLYRLRRKFQQQSDKEAIASDWAEVCKDMEKAIKTVEKELADKLDQVGPEQDEPSPVINTTRHNCLQCGRRIICAHLECGDGVICGACLR